MSKTIKQLADELNVSRQYIHKVIRLLPSNSQPKKVDNKYIVDTKSEKQIKKYMETRHSTKSTRKPRKQVDTVEGLQQDRIEDLKEQNNFYRDQIKELQKRLENSQKLIDQEQQLHLSDQKRIEKLEQPEKQNNPTSKETEEETTDNQPEEQPKKSFFKRLFSSK